MATTIGRTITQQITVRTIDIRPANHNRDGSGRLKTPLQTSVQSHTTHLRVKQNVRPVCSLWDERGWNESTFLTLRQSGSDVRTTKCDKLAGVCLVDRGRLQCASKTQTWALSSNPYLHNPSPPPRAKYNIPSSQPIQVCSSTDTEEYENSLKV
jgi:hypothetical protein